MFKFVRVLFCFIFFFSFVQASIFSDYRAKNAYSNSEFKKTIQILEKEQVEKPNDPIINYNLGTAYYKLNNFEQAKQNLHRCVSNCTEEQSKIKEKAYFNWGNALFKSGLKLLGNNWEKEQVSNETLDKAITEIKSSIEKYGNVLVLNKDNEWASSNKKKAEELLRKLEEKKQQNKQEQNKDNSDKQDGSHQDGSHQDGDNKEKSESDSNDKQNSSQENKKNGQSQKSEQKDKRDNSSQDSKENGDKGKDKELDSNKNSGKDHSMDKREQNSSSHRDGEQKQNQDLMNQDSTDQDSQKEDTGQDLKQQEKSFENKKETSGQQVGAQQVGAQLVGSKEKNDIKSKMLRAVLDDLQNDEAELQKAMIRYKSKGAKPKLNQGQKPW